MFGETIFDEERLALIASGCRFFADPNKDRKLGDIVLKSAKIFKQWHIEQADSNGMVKAPRMSGGGILAAIHNNQYPELAPIGDTTVYQCAQVVNNDDIDLAFKLWLEDYEPFIKFAKEYGFFRVFAVVGLYCYKDASIHSLIRLTSFLAKPIEERAENYVADQIAKITASQGLSVSATKQLRAEQLAKARPNAKTKLEQHSNTITRGVRDWLANELERDPNLKATDATSKLLKQSWLTKLNGKRLQRDHTYRRLVCPIMKELRNLQ